MSLRIYVPRDAAAVAVGADEVALVLGLAASKRGVEIEIVRTGSRGLCWLEPMIEVATPKGRVAFGRDLLEGDRDVVGTDGHRACIARNEDAHHHRCASATSASIRASSSRPTTRPSSIADGAVAHRPRQ